MASIGSGEWMRGGAEQRLDFNESDRPSGAHPVARDRTREDIEPPEDELRDMVMESATASSPMTPSGIFQTGEGRASAGTLLPPGGIDLRSAVDAFENNLIRQALERTRWNKNQAAKLLGLNRTTLVEMLKRKGIRAA